MKTETLMAAMMLALGGPDVLDVPPRPPRFSKPNRSDRRQLRKRVGRANKVHLVKGLRP